MSGEVFPFKIGQFECMAVSDGTMTYAPPNFPLPAVLLFTNASGEPLRAMLRGHSIQLEEWAEWVSPYICLVVKTDSNLVLVDTGAGDLAPTTGKLIPNLRAGGIAPDDIDTVIITHGHPDHIGGNVDSEGKPAFRNARYVMLRDEWDFWTSGQAEKEIDEHIREVLLKYARENLPPIQGQMTLVDSGTEIIPGIQAIAAPGHTPGHMLLAITSDGEHLLCVSDAVLHPVHLEQPEWFAAVDISPEQIVATRRWLLKKAVSDKALVLAFHFPFPGLGNVVPKGDAWQWRPL